MMKGFFRFRISQPSRDIIAVCLWILLVIAFFPRDYRPEGSFTRFLHPPWRERDINWALRSAFIWSLPVSLFHVWLRVRFPKTGTHDMRWGAVPALFLYSFWLGLVPGIGAPMDDEGDLIYFMTAFAMPLYPVIAVTVVAWTLPASPLGSFPIWLVNFAACLLITVHSGVGLLWIVLPILLVSALCSPYHRRLRDLNHPGRLPRLRKGRSPSGITLIELLIILAIISIMSVGIGGSASTALRAQRRQELRREALAAARDEIAFVRGMDELPPVGEHPLRVEIARDGAFAETARLIVKPGPNDDIAEVTVRIEFIGADADRPLLISALVPIPQPKTGETEEVR